MTRKDLYQSILYKILDDFSGLAVNSASFDDIYDAIDNGDIQNAVSLLKSEPTLNSVVIPILNSINVNYTIGSSLLDIDCTGYFFMLFQNHSDAKYRRLIQYASPELTVFETERLFLNVTEYYETQLWMAIERCLVDNNRLQTMMNKLQAGSDDTYSVIYNKQILGIPIAAYVDVEELYAFALSKMLNAGSHVVVPTSLNYICPHPFNTVFNYNQNVEYKQYYDIYNVLDEWLHSSDLLMAFLKMYQILEYVVFREQFKEIVDNSTLKQSFLQQIKKLNLKDGERQTFVRVLPTIFSGFKTQCEPKLVNVGHTIEAQDFIKDYLTKDKVGSYLLHTGQAADVFDKGVAMFIYDMRCCIVHNKEAEFHITYHNVSIYQSVIPLMKEILLMMGEKIINLINNPNSKIRYTNKNLSLY